MKKTGKVLLTIFASIFGIILLGIAIFAFTFRNELSAISSIKLIKDHVLPVPVVKAPNRCLFPAADKNRVYIGVPPVPG